MVLLTGFFYELVSERSVEGGAIFYNPQFVFEDAGTSFS